MLYILKLLGWVFFYYIYFQEWGSSSGAGGVEYPFIAITPGQL